MKLNLLLLLLTLYGCRYSERFVERTIILDDKLGTLTLQLPASCDSFIHRKGKVLQDSLKGDLFDYSYYSYSTSPKSEFPNITVSFKHQPFDITDTDITFDSAVCVQFLADNQAKYYLGYLLARNCVFVKDRYFSVEAIGKTEQPTNEISLRAFTYVGRRILTTNISMVMPDTTGVYNKMLDILRTISIK